MTYSLFDLNEHIRRIMALNFPAPLWVTAEIAQLKQARGHIFLDLVQKGAGTDSDVVAQSTGVMWARTHQQLYMRLGAELAAVLREGLQVKIQVRVDFHERHGLKLLIEDIEPAYTLGQFELQRRQTLQRLRDAGLLEQQRRLTLPAVLQRIAVLSSAEAAGWHDFRTHLEHNALGYRFRIQLFAAAVQGQELEREMLRALELVRQDAVHFDGVVILRGGGARLDLAGFDSYALGKAAAEFPLPIFTGIGHEIDETVLDLAAYAALKTPTAAADFLLQHNAGFESNLLRLGEQLRIFGENQRTLYQISLERQEHGIYWAGRERLRQAHRELQQQESMLPLYTSRLLHQREKALQQAEAFCEAMAPEKILRRGFSITRHNGHVVTAPTDLRAGDRLDTQVAGGQISSVVE